MYRQTPTGLAPEIAIFEQQEGAPKVIVITLLFMPCCFGMRLFLQPPKVRCILAEARKGTL